MSPTAPEGLHDGRPVSSTAGGVFRVRVIAFVPSGQRAAWCSLEREAPREVFSLASARRLGTWQSLESLWQPRCSLERGLRCWETAEAIRGCPAL